MRKKLVILAFLILTGVSAAATTCTVYGTIYEWSTFEPLKNVIVTINTTPPQELVAKNGTYSFNLPPGTYLIEAKYYVNNSLVYSAEENIILIEEGIYVRDILLFPSLEDEKLFEEPELTASEDINLTLSEEPAKELPLLEYAAITLVIAIAVIATWRFKSKKEATPLPVAVNLYPELPEDLKQVLEIICRAGGRMTQKDLRKQLSVSEAKVSLLLTDLEDRGLIKKIKKGRGNIIILIDSKDKITDIT